jgi:hypothetical protein
MDVLRRNPAVNSTADRGRYFLSSRPLKKKNANSRPKTLRGMSVSMVRPHLQKKGKVNTKSVAITASFSPFILFVTRYVRIIARFMKSSGTSILAPFSPRPNSSDNEIMLGIIGGLCENSNGYSPDMPYSPAGKFLPISMYEPPSGHIVLRSVHIRIRAVVRTHIIRRNSMPSSFSFFIDAPSM